MQGQTVINANGLGLTTVNVVVADKATSSAPPVLNQILSPTATTFTEVTSQQRPP